MNSIKKILKWFIDIFYFFLLIICILVYFFKKEEFLFCARILLVFRGLFIISSIPQDISSLLQKDDSNFYIKWKLIYKLACFISLFFIYYLIYSDMPLSQK